jgi:hypothetical protein
MEDKPDIACGAVGQVIWKYLYILNREAAGEPVATTTGRITCIDT